MTALRDEQTIYCKQGFKQQQITRSSNVLFWCSAKQATMYKWLRRFWLSMVIICVKRGSQIQGISWQLVMYIERCVNKSKFLLYVPRMVTETRQNGFLDLPLTANKVRTFPKLSLLCLFQLNCWRAVARQQPILYNSKKQPKFVRCKIGDMRIRLDFILSGHSMMLLNAGGYIDGYSRPALLQNKDTINKVKYKCL